MRKRLFWYFGFALLCIAAAFVLRFFSNTRTSVEVNTPMPTSKPSFSMQITSLAFSNNGEIPAKYTCDGDGVNPPLEFKAVPPETKSLALVVHDPDAPKGDWVHWLVWNINPTTSGIAENSVPAEALQGVTDFGQKQYGGPCPPSGTHHYVFKLYALDSKLDISTFSDRTALEQALAPHILTQAELVGLYSKK